MFIIFIIYLDFVRLIRNKTYSNPTNGEQCKSKHTSSLLISINSAILHQQMTSTNSIHSMKAGICLQQQIKPNTLPVIDDVDDATAAQKLVFSVFQTTSARTPPEKYVVSALPLQESP